MIVNRPDIVRRDMQLQRRARGPLGLRALLRRGRRAVWPWTDGAAVLVCWQGERLPYPTLDPHRVGLRQAAVVGLAPALSGSVDTFADVTFSDGVFHFAVVAFGSGGVPAMIEPAEVCTRVFDGGELVGLLPNAPALVQVRRLPGNLPRVGWTYSALGQQAAPTTFEVYVAEEATEFDFDNPAGSVAFAASQRRYGWTGSALAPGDVRYYTVRAVSAENVKSLIPRNGRCPAAAYNAVDKGYTAYLEVPAGPPADIGTLGVEVFDEL